MALFAALALAQTPDPKDNVSLGAIVDNDATCTTPSGFQTGDPGGTEFNLLYVPVSYDALTLCLASGGTSLANTFGNLAQCLL